MTWQTALQHLATERQDAVLVTLAAVRGHAPREAGAKMVVSRGQTWGSVGGGNLEATAVERARALLATGARTPELLTLRLNDRAPNEHGRQCCGGEVTLLLDPVPAARPALAIFGVGHVGLELARIVSRWPIDLHLVDSRAAQLTPEALSPVENAQARVHVHHAPIPELVLADLPAGAHLVILTHDHAEDAALCDAALRRPDLGFLGLIGSAAKWARFEAQLRALGHDPAALARVTTPIGLPALMDGPGRKRPETIALAVAAQLMAELAAEPSPMPTDRTP